jgi:hypothetical protein
MKHMKNLAADQACVKLPIELMKKAAERAKARRIPPEQYVAQALEQTLASETLDQPQSKMVAEEFAEKFLADNDELFRLLAG